MRLAAIRFCLCSRQIIVVGATLYVALLPTLLMPAAIMVDDYLAAGDLVAGATTLMTS